ncbi:CCR4-NOT transcription complex subunit 6 [Hetaerina americana]|uniref:CCR4-NOT transcription complex subunit 6 n=1 Tax=Hetaerina americana TaxID=62018 RepID=UPI003A7F4662
MSRSSNKDKSEIHNRRVHSIMNQDDIASGKRSQWSELEISGTVRNLSPHLWRLQHLTVLYMNNNCLSRIPADIGRLHNLQHLDLSNNKLRSLPSELGDLICLRELQLNNNVLRVLPYEIGKLFQLQILGLKGNPLTKEILNIYGDGLGTSKLLAYMLDNLTVTTAHPPQRPWIPLTRPSRAKPACIFTVMCYNILCDKFATRQMYGYCPGWALQWDYRKKGILNEIRHYAADIISLQEVETDQFHNFFLPELKADGYDGIFSPKSRAKTMAENERKYVDGCAIFYRRAKFTMEKEYLVEFNQLAMAQAEGSDDMLNRVMPKDNIGLAALLHTNDIAWENGLPVDSSGQVVPQRILVCTAHIHWDPEYCDVKLIQTMMLSHELRVILDEIAGSESLLGYRMSMQPHKPRQDSVHLLLCGDFNSLPDSGVVEFLTTGRVSADHPDFKELLGYKSCLRKISPCDRPNEYTHSFKLASAYSSDVMAFTNFTYDFKGIIDYIFYPRMTMTPLGLLGPLAHDWFRDNKVVGCPHPHVPSDHFPLLVELEMTASILPNMNGLIVRR